MAHRYRERLLGLLYPIAGILLVVAVLEALSRAEILPRDQFPPMTEVFRTLLDQVQTSGFWEAVLDTLAGWAIGLGIAVAVAVPVGIAIAANEFAYRALRPIIEFLRPIPAVALIPLAILIYGSGLDLKVFLVAFGAVWPVLIQTLYGVRDVDPVALDTARAYGLGGVARMLRVTLPGAVPYIATGVRISSAVALILAVTAELVVGVPGLGRQILVAQSGGAVTLVYALILTTGVLGWLLNATILGIEVRVLRWHPAYRVSGGIGGRVP